jgi:dCMP deaminase
MGGGMFLMMKECIDLILKKVKGEETVSDANTNHISWNQYFMGLAKLASLRSKDPRSQVGAVIVDTFDNRVISIGHNGFPYGCSDNEFPWKKGADLAYEDTKYAYVVHAELNAIISARGTNLYGKTMYVTYSPCNECMKAIIQSGIKNVIYMTEYDKGSAMDIASRRMAAAAGIHLQKYSSSDQDIDLGLL